MNTTYRTDFASNTSHLELINCIPNLIELCICLNDSILYFMDGLKDPKSETDRTWNFNKE